MNFRTLQRYLAERNRYLAELHRLNTQAKDLATRKDSKYADKLDRNIRDLDDRIAALGATGS